MSVVETPWLYQELAGWWHLFSPPSHYVEEAQDLLPELLAASDAPPRTLLELGAGAGSLACHLKGKLDLTLTDRSPQMLEVSRRVTTDNGSLEQVFATAYKHLRPGGGALFVPDCVQETFEPATTTGGEDGPDGRALRYLQWTWDPDPGDQSYDVAWAFVFREADGSVRVETDHHQFGLFPRAAWFALMREVGFVARSRLDPWGRDVFVARKPSGSERGA